MSLFDQLCDGQPLLNVTQLRQDPPELNPCLLETLLVWVPHGFLWLSLVPYLVYLRFREKDPVLPFSKKQASKCVFSVLLIILVLVNVIATKVNGYKCGAYPHPGPAFHLAAGIEAATLVLNLVMEQIMRRVGVKTSGVAFMYWCLLAVAELGQLYSAITSPAWCVFYVVDYIRFVIICVQFILRCSADHYGRRGYIQLDSEKNCPHEDASVLNTVTYHWVTSLVVKAYKETLTSKDLWQQVRFLRSRHVVPKFLRAWRQATTKFKAKQLADNVITYGHYRSLTDPKQEIISETTALLNTDMPEGNGGTSFRLDSLHSINNAKGPSIFSVILKVYGWLWFEACCYKIVGDVFSLLQPLILQQVIGIVENRDTNVDGDPAWYGYAYTVGLFVTSLMKSLLYHCTFNHNVVLGMRIKIALIGAVYRKAMNLNNKSSKSYTVGEIVNLMSVDCQRVQDAFTYSHYIVSLPFMVTVSMVQLWWLMGVSMVGGLAVVFLTTAANAYVGRLQQRLQKEILNLKGTRIKILNEVINGIKVLKMYTWEIPFGQRVTSIRQQELKRFRKNAILTAVAILFSIHSPFMVNWVLVMIYTLSQSIHYLDASTAFVALSLVNILRGPITITPFVITGVIQGYVSLVRIQTFLWKEEIDTENTTITDEGEYTVSVDDATFTWDVSIPRPTLKNIHVHMGAGQVYAVVGQVGCGKTSLISAILGDMERKSGSVQLKGTVAYVPQEAWIQNLTVRDNILFGKPMDETRYNKVLQGCALLPDLSILSGGDMTEIGEKGINISGGQKQRVSLARAVYSDADIYLLDDPLSAVDSHVGKHLFKNVIGSQGLLKKKTRILVTHGVHWLPMVDKIIVMTDGHISETGTYNDLISRDGPFANFIYNYGDNEEAESEDDEVKQLREKVLSDVEQHVKADGTISDDNEPSISARRKRRRRTSSREKSFGMSFSKHDGPDNKSQKDQAMSVLIQEEKSQKGAVQFSVFQKYGRAMGYWAVILSMILMVAFQGFNVYSNYWITYWTEDPILKNTSIGHTELYQDTFTYYIIGYTVIGVIQGIAVFAFGAVSLTRMVRAAGVLHKEMLSCILQSPLSFFDTTPVGRIINRFSSDIDVIDDRLPMNFRLWNIQLMSALATVIVVSINTPYFMIVIVPVSIVYVLLLKFFLPTARQVKRLESVLRSPIYNHFSESITGISVIRAYRCMPRFIDESQRRVDTNAKFFFAANSGSRWIGVRLEFLGNLLIVAATLFALLSEGLNGAEVGLSITYALQITISLNLVIQAVSEMEMNIVSAERVTEFTELAAEAPWRNLLSGRLGEWPQSGGLEFRGYQTRYRPGLELVLKGISCRIQSGEKIGIVGRTGAGKSSLTLSLFRLIEAAGGAIILDGQNISEIGLHDLRSKLTILPQDPVLFSGSLRENLDPFGKFDEAAMWRALECAHLKTAVTHMPGKLDYECGEGGSNLSMGQRQLVCLARTLLHKTRILILDEATAAVDLETDDLIQNTIRTEFADCTILTIAHRLNTIMDYDRVMVLSEGQILELDVPSKLLQNRNGAFFKMASDAGLIN